jgi:exopolysaccharide biosynthesis WecB/TagA/CpsF family protein
MSLTGTPPDLAVIDGRRVNLADMGQAVRAAVGAAAAGRGFSLFTLNLDHLVKARADERFAQAYDRAAFVTADGAPVVALARREGAALERTTGADLVFPLCEQAAGEGVPVFLFGASQSALEAAAAALQARCPGLDVRGREAPPYGFDPFSPDAEAAGDRIAASGARLCFLALGAPKQELFADRMVARGLPVGFVCIGAALDFIAGEQKRAPALWRKIGMEWAWRLLSNPRRLGMRYARCAVLFAELWLAGRSSGAPRPQPA